MSHSTITLTSPNGGQPTKIILYPSISLTELTAVLTTTFPPPHPAMSPVGVKDTNRDIHYPLQILTAIPKYFEKKTYSLQWSTPKEAKQEAGQGEGWDGSHTSLAMRDKRMLVSTNVVHRVMNLFRKVRGNAPL